MAGTAGNGAGRAPDAAVSGNAQRGATCRDCRYFIAEPRLLEEAIPGLGILSSAFGSVRADTALCDHDGVFITAMLACRNFCPKDFTPGSR